MHKWVPATMLVLLVACAHREETPVMTDWVGHNEDELDEVYGEPIDIEYDEEGFKIVTFTQDKQLETPPDAVTTRTYTPQPGGTIVSRPITRADLHGGEDYTVSYRFWIDADGLIHRFESRIQ